MNYKNIPVLIILILFNGLKLQGQQYNWQKNQAEVFATGDLKWKPKLFSYPVQPGETVRYIDYENGNDNLDGQTKNSAWKHHPWDTRARGKAAESSGVQNYVFKRGVFYRIFANGKQAFLNARQSGQAGQPIRLTSDPSWGQGEAIIAGSKLIEQNWQPATNSDVPQRMNPEKVWYIDINMPEAPQNNVPLSIKENFGMWSSGKKMAEMILFLVDREGKSHNLHIASDAGWHMTNPNFALHHWNQWDGEKVLDPGQGKKDMQGFDDALIGFDPDYFDGGTLWSQYGWIISTPAPYIIQPGDYDPDQGILAHRRMAHPLNPGTRYLIENLPQFLDQPGEYYFDADYSSNSGRLFLRLPDDTDPNQARLEMASAWTSIKIEEQEHIEISGLTFRFNGRKGNVIDVSGNCEDIVIQNCQFENLANDAVFIKVEADQAMENIRVRDCDFNWVNGGTAIGIQGHSGKIQVDQSLGKLSGVEVLRNRSRNSGIYRHNDHRWSNVPAMVAVFCRKADIAGNIVDTAFGSGVVVQGGKSGKDSQGADIPLIRILVHHNKIENTALGVNDYGGLSLWQHGPIYSYSNIVGNAVGHWPGGFHNSGTINLSYPIYLDGGFKIYNFNNISWARPHSENDPYTSGRSAYFNVFGYLNPFVNNTIVGSGIGLGGTSGNRNDYLGNIFSEITQKYISVNHGGNPSLIGGDDTGSSGIDGATTLAYGYNIFHGPAEAGTVATVKRGAKKDLDAAELEVLNQQMKDYPLRFAQLGQHVNQLPIASCLAELSEHPAASRLDFRPDHPAALDQGISYFVPWGLYATVAEWHFNQNNSDPATILDYHHYPTLAYFHRSMYHKVPVFELEVNQAATSDYVPSDSESWAPGALDFDGTRFARLSHHKMKNDVMININEWQGNKHFDPPKSPWVTPEADSIDGEGKPKFGKMQFLRYPGTLRKTPDMDVNNFLLETIIRLDPDKVNGMILSKFNGQTGYRLFVNEKGTISFEVRGGGKQVLLSSSEAYQDGQWHHILAEIDRASGQMHLYVDGKMANEKIAEIPPTASLSNQADLLVGVDHEGNNYLHGAIDFMRISRGTLADAETDIRELYTWQMDGPVNHDFAGQKPKGQRDIGAIEQME